MYNTIIDPHTLAAHVENRNWVVMDCRFNLMNPEEGRQLYHQGHIPNARFMDLNQDLASAKTATTGRHPLPDAQQLASKLGELGVDENTQVVVYDADCGAFAARLWWLLRWLGHEAVAVLDGGLKGWQQAGHGVTPELPKITSRHFTAHPDNNLWVDTAFVESFIDANGVLLDARSPERFRGEQEPSDPVAGHIPTACNMPFMGNLNQQQQFLSAEQLRQRFDAVLNGCSVQKVVCMCGSGVTACHNLLALEIAGLSGARLYVGSWSEWITSSARPVATGA